MLITRITQLGITKSTLLAPALLSNPLIFYPTAYISKVCPGSKGKGPSSPGAASGKPQIKRALKSGPCRLCFVPEEWFLFFHSKTGVSGPYLLGLGIINYLVSKEIFIMEHEYYLGLSMTLVLYTIVTKFGAQIGTALDKDVDAIANEFEQSRKDEISDNENWIKKANDMQWRAEGQKDLMSAKKENIAMQLEAEYRDRAMRVYRAVRGRMDYHVKKYRSETRIQQKWMTGWILKNVNQSITPEFQQQALASAIRDLTAAAANQGKK